MSRAVFRSIQIPLLALAFGLWAVPVAHAVQASGSIQLIPSKQLDLAKNDTITLDVSIVNNSTTTPPGAIAPNPASLTGPITVDYTCTNPSCDCTITDPARFSFVSCSIVGAPAGVVSCVPGAPGQVIINLAAGGISLPASTTPLFLAKLTIKNNLDKLPFTRFRASTDVCALESCVSLGTDCATCAAEGCSFARGPQETNQILSCKHGCLNRISFFSGLDKLHFNGLVQAQGYDPSADTFSLTLSKGGTIFTVTLPNLPQVATRTWRIFGPGNSTTPGFEEIEVTKRTGTVNGVDCTDGWFKVIVDGWGDMTPAQVKDPQILVELGLGASSFVNNEPWTSLPAGAVNPGDITAVVNDFDVRSPC
jgi:hypothetical protein